MEDSNNIFISIPDVANLQLPDPELRQYYVDLQSRTIWIDEEISGSARAISKAIIQWNREDALIDPQDRRPIKLLIASPGGSLDVADGLVSVIKLSQTPVWGVAMECVASAASLIYLACHRKLAMPNAYFIFHEGSCSNMSGNYSDVQAAMRDYEEAVEKMKQYYIDNTNYTDEEVRANIKADWYIRVEEALDKGVVDEVVTDIFNIM